MTWWRCICMACEMRCRLAGGCWTVAGRPSMPSRQPSSSWKMTKPSTRGVGCVERVRNPVRAARKILSESPHVYFVGEGAERFAAEHGVELCRNDELIIEREKERLRAY